MEITGKIKKIDETKTFGASSFRKREMVITTDEQYPQILMVEFVQDKCDALNNFKVDDNVTISINLRGREWINPQGEAVYFNSIQGWRIEALNEATDNSANATPNTEEEDDLPF